MNVVEIIKAIVGPMIVIVVAWLAYSIINGNVTERNSFGLNGVIAIISALSAAYALWAYGAFGYKGGGNGTDKKA